VQNLRRLSWDRDSRSLSREWRIWNERLRQQPALASLLAALEENGIKTLICEKLDRIARDLMVQEAIIADLRKKGYTLISTCEPDLCSDDPSRVLIRQIFGALAQWDRAMTCQKLRAARERKKAKTGRCEGRKPLGVCREKRSIAGNPPTTYCWGWPDLYCPVPYNSRLHLPRGNNYLASSIGE